MDKLFLSVLNMNLTAGFVIAAIILARFPLKKAPKVISYALWAAAGFRLIFPFSFESVISLIPFKPQPIPQTALLGENISFASAAGAAYHAVGDALNGGLGTVTVYLDRVTPGGFTATTEAYHSQVWLMFGSYVWITGTALLLIFSMISIIKLKRELLGAVFVEGNIYETANLKTPFVSGLFLPKIYIPAGLNGEERRYIILHEQTHIRRHDQIFKMLAYLIVCLHWFNPLVWAAFILMNADMEMSCDERVMRELGGDIKTAYSLSLVHTAAGRRILNGTPVAFGEGCMKERVKNVLKFKKPSKFAVIAAAVLAAVLAAGCAVNQISPVGNSDTNIPDITATETIDGAQAKLQKFGYSWFDGKTGVVADSIAPRQGKYTSGNTLVIDGEMGQNMILLSAENLADASYAIYLPDGTLYDSGTREVYDSLSSRLYWADDGTKIGLIAPFTPGEYIYEIEIRWDKNDLKATYGLKVVMTGERNAYDEALSLIPEYFGDVISMSFKETGQLNGAELEHAGECYIFDVELPDGTERAAYSKEKGIFFTGIAAERNVETRLMTLDDVRAISQKIGTDLTLEDLRDFTGDDIGFGIFIMRYYIKDAPYMLLVGFEGRNTVAYADLMHIAITENKIDDSIDIRYYDADKFIADGIKELVRPLPVTKPKETTLPDTHAAESSLDGAFFTIIMKLFKMSEPLNKDIKYIAVDMDGVFTHTNLQLRASLEFWAKKMDCSLLIGSYEDLCESGHIIPGEGFTDGILFSFINAVFDGETLTAEAQKYRYPNGTAGASFKIRLIDGIWIADEPEGEWIS